MTTPQTGTETPECEKHGPMELHTGETPEQRYTGTWYGCTSPGCWNAHLIPSPALAAALDAQARTSKGTLTIAHVRAEGTLLYGSRKHDGAFELIRRHGFRYFPSLSCLGIGKSRDKAAKRWNINAAAEALRAAGWTVVIEIDEDTRRSFAEAEADRVERAEGRAERYADRASSASASSDAAYNAAHRIADSIPFGQPILVGHHSEGRARRDAARIDNGMRKSIAEGERAGRLASSAEAAEHYEAYRNNPGRTLRRIAKLEADQRRNEKWLAGKSAGGFPRDITNPDTVAELERRKAELAEELDYWRGIVAKAEEETGFKVWGKSDFAKGDFVRYHGAWYEVLRVNAKSVTIPHIHNGIGRSVVRKGDGDGLAGYTWTAPYDGVSGRRSAEEMAAAEAPAEAATEAPAEAETPVMHEDRFLPLDR